MDVMSPNPPGVELDAPLNVCTAVLGASTGEVEAIHLRSKQIIEENIYMLKFLKES